MRRKLRLKVNQRIHLKNGATILLIRITGRRCTIGIDAPRDVRIRRID